MQESELYQYRGKEIEVTCTGGQKLSGFCAIVTSAYDNDPDPASLCLECSTRGLVEILLPEIQSITVLD